MHFGGFELLRAVAATMVVLHHAASLAGPDRAGPIATSAAVMDGGVAVFFVLSGFLIYRQFAVAHLQGRPVQLTRGFWWRRVLRIVPAYWLCLTFFWALGSFHLGSDWWRYYLFLQIYSKATVLGGVVQAWSLCTEMSFYFVVPFVVAVVVRVAGSGATAGRRAGVHLAACALLWVAGIASRILVEAWAPSYRQLSFNWLPANLDLFASGMALAVLSAWAADHAALRDRLDRLCRWVGPWWLAAGALFAWYAYRVGPADFATGYAGWFWQRRQLTLGLFTVLLMAPAVFGDQSRGWARRLWGWRPLAWVGVVSYGLYLWHLDWMERAIERPVTLASAGWPGWVHTAPGDSSYPYLVAVGMGVGLLFAAASWYLMEQPLQRYKALLDRK